MSRTDAGRRQGAARATARSISSSWPTARTRRCAAADAQARAPIYPWGCMWTTVPDPPASVPRRLAAPARSRHARDDGPAAGRATGSSRCTGACPASALAPGIGRSISAWRQRAGRRSGRKRRNRRRRGRGRRFLARDLSPCRPAALERGPGAVHRRCRARHQPAARPGRQSRPGRCLDAGRCARRNADIPSAIAALRRAPRLDRALLSPGQPSADAVLPVGLEPFGWLRDAFMGSACRAAGFRGR